jgi:hypothetical protein
MNSPKLCMCSLALVAFVGCDQAASPNKTRSAESVAATTNYQRFVPVGSEAQPTNVYVVRAEHWFIALDTKTGQICKTTQVSFPKQEVLDSIPQCLALYASDLAHTSPTANP